MQGGERRKWCEGGCVQFSHFRCRYEGMSVIFLLLLSLPGNISGSPNPLLIRYPNPLLAPSYFRFLILPAPHRTQQATSQQPASRGRLPTRHLGNTSPFCHIVYIASWVCFVSQLSFVVEGERCIDVLNQSCLAAPPLVVCDCLFIGRVIISVIIYPQRACVCVIASERVCSSFLFRWLTSSVANG